MSNIYSNNAPTKKSSSTGLSSVVQNAEGNPISNVASATKTLEDSKESLRILREMSSILNCGLQGEALGSCVRLIEEGCDPVALAGYIKAWRKEQEKVNE